MCDFAIASPKVSVVLNKVDILRDMDVNVEEFTLKMRELVVWVGLLDAVLDSKMGQ